MTDPGAFDQYAKAYSESVNAVLGAAGESVDFFAQQKATLTAQHLSMEPQSGLDFGCGVGLCTRWLCQTIPHVAWTGYDTSEESIQTARRSHQTSGVRFIAGRGSTLPFPDCTFDVAFTSCVFHHIARPEHLHWAQELHRVLAPGGRLFLFEHNPYNPFTLHVVRTCPFDEGVTLLRPGYAARMLAPVGFRVERPRFYFFFPRPLRSFRSLERYFRWMPIGAQYYVVASRRGTNARRQ